jgi:hypothetical protein
MDDFLLCYKQVEPEQTWFIWEYDSCDIGFFDNNPNIYPVYAPIEDEL